MMPIMTGGISAIPPALVSHASAINNVVQRTTAALGLAILTAVLTSQQAQLLADRTGLVPADAAAHLPQLGGGAEAGFAGSYALYQQTSTQVFVSALDELFIITAVLTAVGVLLALMLRTARLRRRLAGPPRRAAGCRAGEAASRCSPEPSASAGGDVENGHVDEPAGHAPSGQRPATGRPPAAETGPARPSGRARSRERPAA